MSDRLCIRCRQRESEHIAESHGALRCPPVTSYFNPCRHERQHGWGQITLHDGFTGESTCDDCGESFKGCLAKPVGGTCAPTVANQEKS